MYNNIHITINFKISKQYIEAVLEIYDIRKTENRGTGIHIFSSAYILSLTLNVCYDLDLLKMQN